MTTARSEFARSDAATRPARIGVLCYDLQPFAEDCLYRIAQSIEPLELKAYPLYFHAHQAFARFPHRSTHAVARFWGLDSRRRTPEGFAAGIEWATGAACAFNSDVILFFGLQGATALWTVLLGWLLRKPMISVNQTLQIRQERERRWWIRAFKGWLLGRCVSHVVQTPVSHEVLRDVYGVDEERLFFAPFEAGARAFDALLAKPRDSRFDARAIARIPENATVFLFVGNLHPFKGVPLLLEAAALLGELSAFYVFAGMEGVPGAIAGYERYATELGIRDNVRFVGALPQDKLVDFYRAADVVVLPTYRDTFGKILVEAALMGKPLITTTASGAVGAIVQDGINGFVVAVSDAVALSDALRKCLSPSLRIALGSHSSALARRFCDAERECAGFRSAILSALGSPKVL